jgi:hypothetical protein
MQSNKGGPNDIIEEGHYWTSATDNLCEGRFGWCAVNRLVRNAIWASNQPDNNGGNAHCISINVQKSKAELSDNNCEEAYKYICEVIKT